MGPPEDRVTTRGPRPLLVPLDKGSDPLLLNRSFSRLGVASLPSGPQGARPAPSAALIAESSLTRFRRGGGGGREQMVLEWMHAEVPSGGSPAVCPGAGCSPSLRLGPHHLVAQRCWCPSHGVAAHREKVCEPAGRLCCFWCFYYLVLLLPQRVKSFIPKVTLLTEAVFPEGPR